MQMVFETVDKVAQAVVPVLVVGETGTGKEVIARAIHERGPRKDEPFRCLNCGGMSPQLVESTLFGFERGAFTGAMHQSKGIFEAANGGTVLLDEIGELPLEAQASLLRVLETKRVQRVGATEEVDLDVRVVAATHRDLEAMCRDGTFRWDLYFRLNVISVRVPPLRARPEDVPPLVEMFVRRAAQTNRMDVDGIHPDAMEHLVRYDWPGNVRELKNTIEHAVVVTGEGQILPSALPDHVVGGGTTVDVEIEIEDVRTQEQEIDKIVEEIAPPELLDFKAEMAKHEIDVILRALELTNYNQTEAAKRLKMPLRTFVHKMKVHDIRSMLPNR